MDRSVFPALYRAASASAQRHQNLFFTALGVHLVCLLVAAFLSVFNPAAWLFSLVALIALVVALGCSILLAWLKPDGHWYLSRALAESVKTIAWRFSVRVEPFNLDDEVAVPLFASRLREILEQNGETIRKFKLEPGEDVSTQMLSLRRESLEARRSTYVAERVDAQQAWYATRAAQSQRHAHWALVALIVFNLAAVVCAVVKLNVDYRGPWPTEIFVTGAACLLSWSQARRFSELAASYSLAAAEIRLIKAQGLLIASESEFSAYVGDAENAFSREHTQWVARKDSPR